MTRRDGVELMRSKSDCEVNTNLDGGKKRDGIYVIRVPFTSVTLFRLDDVDCCDGMFGVADKLRFDHH